MSDGSLSQDEIDALLQGTGGMEFDTGPAAVTVNDQQLEEFRALIESTLDSQKSNLSMLVSNEVELKASSVEVVNSEQLPGSLPESMVVITMNLTEGTPGRHLYVIDSESALSIAGPTMGQDGVELDDAAVNALQEAFSQIAGPVITALGEKAGVAVMNEPPGGTRADASSVQIPQGDLVRITYDATIGGEKSVQIHELFEAGVVVAALSGGAGAAPTGLAGMAATAGSADTGGLLGGLMAGAPAGGMSGDMGGMQMGGLGGPNVQSVQFPGLTPAGTGSEQGNIGLLMDVFMEMTVELGRTRKLIKEILGMGEGTIIELDKLAGEPVDILVNHKLIAKGEVVVIDENFGVRVTEIVSPMDRMGNGMP
ncbi:MAG: flagellar motor switch protein FliN [Spirochaetaceae bacterium]|nr:flagellar motor switch protein FliN [Spirochaetaceae bacterium]